MDELDRALADLRRAVVDGGVRVRVERWRRAAPHADPAPGTGPAGAVRPVPPPAPDPLALPLVFRLVHWHRQSAASDPAASDPVAPALHATPAATPAARQTVAEPGVWARVRRPVAMLLVGALSLLLL